MDEKLLDYLTVHFLFCKLDKEELMQLAPFITEETISRSQFVFLEEEKAKHFYILREGNLRAFIGGKMLTAIQPGQIFGEIAVLNGNIRTGSVFATEDSKVVKINGHGLLNGKELPVSISFRVLKELIKPLTTLQYTHDFFRRTKDIIEKGEGEKTEFKSSLRHNYHTGKFGREIEHATLKTIAAFLNTWGGILLIGIGDRQEVLGIENDRFENDDRAMLHLTNLVKERIGENFLQFIACSIEIFDGKKIMRVDVNPSNLPAYIKENNDEYFYVRTGPATTEMKTSRIYDYIDNRFFRPKAL